MKNKLLGSFFLLMLLQGFVPVCGQGFILQKDILVPKNEVQDNVISLGGHIIVRGEVRENVIAFGGTITVEGEVGETVVGFGSQIFLKSSAYVRGDVVSFGGTLEKEPGSVVKGDTISFSFDKSQDALKFLKEGLFGAFGISLIPLLLIIKLIMLLMWFILAVAGATIFPRQVSLASSQIRKSFWPIFGIGFLSLILFTAFVIFSALLSLVLIGIPILLTLVFLAVIIKLFSRIVLYHFFGESLVRAFGKSQTSVLLSVIMGFVLVSLISLIPIIGAVFSFVLSIIGWGAVIRTKFGTTENWFRK